MASLQAAVFSVLLPVGQDLPGAASSSSGLLLDCTGVELHRQTWEAVESYGMWAPALLTGANFPWVCVLIYIDMVHI